MSFDPYAPYGTPIETTCRVATWNVWGRYGEWAARHDGIRAELRQSAPDVVCITETWETADQDAASLIGESLGLRHCVTWAGGPLTGHRGRTGSRASPSAPAGPSSPASTGRWGGTAMRSARSRMRRSMGPAA